MCLTVCNFKLEKIISNYFIAWLSLKLRYFKVLMHLWSILPLMFSCKSFWIKFHTWRVLLILWFPHHSLFLHNLKYSWYFELLSVETIKIWDNAYNQSLLMCFYLAASSCSHFPPPAANCMGIPFQDLFFSLWGKVTW